MCMLKEKGKKGANELNIKSDLSFWFVNFKMIFKAPAVGIFFTADGASDRFSPPPRVVSYLYVND